MFTPFADLTAGLQPIRQVAGGQGREVDIKYMWARENWMGWCLQELPLLVDVMVWVPEETEPPYYGAK